MAKIENESHYLVAMPQICKPSNRKREAILALSSFNDQGRSIIPKVTLMRKNILHRVKCTQSQCHVSTIMNIVGFKKFLIFNLPLYYCPHKMIAFYSLGPAFSFWHVPTGKGIIINK